LTRHRTDSANGTLTGAQGARRAIAENSAARELAARQATGAVLSALFDVDEDLRAELIRVINEMGRAAANETP
jgi:hypothetical protein